MGLDKYAFVTIQHENGVEVIRVSAIEHIEFRPGSGADSVSGGNMEAVISMSNGMKTRVCEPKQVAELAKQLGFNWPY